MIIPTRLQLDILSCIKKLPSVLASTALVTAQAIPRDEIRSTTVPYVPPAAVSLRAEVRVVEVPVVVRDGQRHIVTGLTRDDFEIYDDGKKQAITAFSVQTDELQLGPVGDAKSSEVAAGPTIQPRSRFLALCFDNLHLSPAALPPVKEAAERFIRTNFAPGDSAVVVSTSQSSNTQFTADVPTLLDQIAKINITHLGVSGDLVACPHFSAYEAYQVANSADPGNQVLNAKVAACSGCSHHPCPESLVRNAAETVWAHVRQNTTNTLGVIDGLVDSMERLPGQRLILLTSSGFLMGNSQADLDRLTEKARRAGVVISALNARGVNLDLSAGGAYNYGMGTLASGTGGAFYHDQNDFDGAFRELGMTPESVYLLSFAPPGLADGRFHKLKVQLPVGKHYSVQARPGYVAQSVKSSATGSLASKVDSEVTATNAVADLPISFTWEEVEGQPGVTMIAHLNISRLHFKPWQNRHTQKLSIVAVVLDDHGSFVAGKRSELELSFRDATFAQLAKTGFPVAMTLKVPPGSYSVRAVAQDGIEGRLTAASDAVRIK